MFIPPRGAPHWCHPLQPFRHQRFSSVPIFQSLESGSALREQPPVVSAKTGMSLTTDGTPQAIASNGGYPKPSANDGCAAQKAFFIKTGRWFSTTWSNQSTPSVLWLCDQYCLFSADTPINTSLRSRMSLSFKSTARFLCG